MATDRKEGFNDLALKIFWMAAFKKDNGSFGDKKEKEWASWFNETMSFQAVSEDKCIVYNKQKDVFLIYVLPAYDIGLGSFIKCIGSIKKESIARYL